MLPAKYLLLLLLLLGGTLITESPGQTDSTRVRPDSADTPSQIPSVADTGVFHPKKSPWLAVGYSAVLPGLGQIYDERYWKAPVIWGIGGYWIYEWIKQNDKYIDYRDRYENSLTVLSGGNERYRELRDFYRDDRDRFAWFLGGLYLLNLVDAYVGAHLYDFDVGPSLSQGGRFPAPDIQASIRFRF